MILSTSAKVLAVVALLIAAPGLHVHAQVACGSACVQCDDEGSCSACPSSGEACYKDNERVSCDSNISALLIFV